MKDRGEIDGADPVPAEPPLLDEMLTAEELAQLREIGRQQSAHAREAFRYLRPTPFSRAEASQIAEEHSGHPIRKVVSAEELAGARAPCPYGGSPLESCWIAYVERPVSGPPSEIVLVSKETGEVLYVGSAHDEG